MPNGRRTNHISRPQNQEFRISHEQILAHLCSLNMLCFQMTPLLLKHYACKQVFSFSYEALRSPQSRIDISPQPLPLAQIKLPIVLNLEYI